MLLTARDETGRCPDTHPTCGEPFSYESELERHYLQAIQDGDETRERSLGTTLQNVAQSPQDVYASVYHAAQAGWPMFPLRPGGKEPLTPNGFKDATADQDTLSRWWIRHGDANAGVATGHLFDVIDVDYQRHPHALDAWHRIADGFAVDGIARTPHGMHLYVLPSGGGNRAKVNGVEGIDYRGRGGYVVMPPSVSVDGRYWWEVRPSPRIKTGWSRVDWEAQAWREYLEGQADA